MEALIVNGVKGADWKAMGSDISRQDAIANHIHAILSNVKPCSLTVVLDCGCGAGSTITPYVLRDMGCHVISLNAQPDGFFPARMPEPVEENLTQLKEAVKAYGADLGIAHDGDADRMVAVDDKGRYVSGDALLAYFCKYEVRTRAGLPGRRLHDRGPRGERRNDIPHEDRGRVRIGRSPARKRRVRRRDQRHLDIPADVLLPGRHLCGGEARRAGQPARQAVGGHRCAAQIPAEKGRDQVRTRAWINRRSCNTSKRSWTARDTRT